MQLPDIFPLKRPDIDVLAERRDIDGLIRALQFPDFDIQWKAASALGSMGVEALDHLIPLLDHPSVDVRLGIIEALGEMHNRKATFPMFRLLDDESFEIRWAAALALGEIGDLRAIDPLVLMLVDPNKYVRYGAAIALEKLGWQPGNVNELVCNAVARHEWDQIIPLGREGVEPLLPFLKDRDPEVRSKAVEVLGTLGGDTARRFCRVALSDSDPQVRWGAVLAGLRCGISHRHIPLGVSRRKRGEKNSIVAGFLNFIFPGMGYQYSGALPPGAGIALWQAYLLCMLVVLLFIHGGFPITGAKLAFFTPLYPLYGWIDISAWLSGANALLYFPPIALALHVWYSVENAPDVL
ncbi:MAG: HEAT repeat domain-containing protein [Methanomicrobiales archaeon]|nr:HEAT repeat domain-containing protein [Methanomicrobiales archaeon]